MTVFGRGVGLTVAVLALALATPAGAQENLDLGKTGAQLYAADCAICHKNAQALNKSGGLLGLSGFLREHYTASRESAASIATYLQSLGSAPAPSKRTATTKRKTKSDDQLGDEKKAKSEEKVKAGEEKEKKIKVDDEKKVKPKSDEAKSKKSDKTSKSEEAKTSEPKTEKKTEKKSDNKSELKSERKTGVKTTEPKTAESKAKDAKTPPPKTAKVKKKPGSAADVKPDKPEKTD